MLDKDKNKKDKLNLLGAGNDFDRHFRQKAQGLFTPLVEKRLGFKIMYSQALQEKIVKTIEREVDFLYKIKSETGKEMLLHIEFQTEKDYDMIYRMQEYHALIYGKYKLHIKHVVVYLGTNKSKMVTTLPDDGVFTSFELICINEMDPQEFLESDVPEMVTLALLGNCKKEQLSNLFDLTVNKLKLILKQEKLSLDYVDQLTLLLRLRKLDDELIKKLEDMPIIYDIEKDILYQRGLTKGETKGEAKGIAKGIAKGKAEESKLQKVKREAERDLSIINLYERQVPIKTIVESLNISQYRVRKVIKEWKMKSAN